MTQIQASVNVKDNVDGKIEQKIKAIGVASVTTATQLSTLQKAINGISSQSINSFSSAVNTLGRTNLSGLRSQMQQLTTISSQLSGSFSSTAQQAVKLQIAQTKLQQEQAKLAILNTRLQQQSTNLATAQQKQATATANLANATARANTAKTRSQIASTQATTATIRLQQAQARLEWQLKRTAQSTNATDTGLRKFVGTMFALSAIASSAMGMAMLGDEYQRLINKLSLVTTNADQARNRLATLTDVALNSYAGLDSVTQLYTRLDLALKQTGGSASEAIQMTQTLSKAVSLAGLTTAEANSALLQISQAFNKGKLDGDEFRTVMETMPPLADAIARQFTKMNNGITVTRGELLKLAPEGKITGEVMKQAVLEMAEVVDQKFAQLTPTLSMHLQNLQTQAQVYFGAMFKDSGMAQALGNSIKWISQNLEIATRLAFAFGSAVAVGMALKSVSSFITMLTAVKKAYMSATGIVATFNAVVGASPIGWIIAGVTALGFVMDSLFDGIIGKTLFPSYDQDVAKTQDYINRLKDINSQMGLMSYTKLTQEQTLLDQAMQRNTTTIDEQKAKIKEHEQAITRKEQALKQAQATVEMYNQSGRSAIDMLAGWGASIDEQAQAEEQVKRLTTELTDERASLTEETRKLEEAESNNTEILKSQLYNLEQTIDRIDKAREAIKDKTDKDIEANAELSAQKEIVEKSKSHYDNLINRVKSLRAELHRLLGINANLDPAINETAEKQADQVMEEAKARIQKQTEYMNKFAKATKDQQTAMTVEKNLGKDLELFRDKDTGKLTKEGQKLLDDRIKAEKALQDRKEADAKREQATRKAERDAENKRKKAESEAQREAKKKANELQKAREELDRYVGKLNDEQTLLQQGYENYNSYNELYALRLKLQQKGYNLTERQVQELKNKIDANERLKELAKEINNLEENSLQKQREQIALKLQAIQKANISDTDKVIANENIFASQGLTTGVNQGVTAIQNEYATRLELLKQYHAQAEMAELEYNMRVQGLAQQRNEAVYNQQLANLHNMGGMFEVTAVAFESFSQNATTSLMNVLNGTQSISDAMRNLASTILTSVVQAIIEMGVKWVAQQVMQMAFGQSMMATQLATSTAMATAMASAWATPASLVSLASYGANAVPAQMGMATTIGMAKTMAVAGARRNGGSVNAGDLYQVGEGNAPEIYQSRSGRQYMIAGDNGRVFSNKQVMGSGGGNVVHVTQNVTINGNGQMDADTLSKMREQTRSVIYEVLADEKRDAGGMLA